MRPGNWLHRHGSAPEVQRVTVFPQEMRILRLDGGVEAVVAVNHAHDDVETIRSANPGKVNSESDLELAGDRNGKRSDFGNVDHGKYDNFSELPGILKFQERWKCLCNARRRGTMRAGRRYRVVLVTCGTLTEGRRIARRAVSARLAACVSIALSPVESFYTWKGKLEKAREYLLVMKTTAKRLAELENEVKRLHSYDVPEFIALKVTESSASYLRWVSSSVTKARYI
jgi:periplasmic divalent cation tolerance protein